MLYTYTTLHVHYGGMVDKLLVALSEETQQKCMSLEVFSALMPVEVYNVQCSSSVCL